MGKCDWDADFLGDFLVFFFGDFFNPTRTSPNLTQRREWNERKVVTWDVPLLVKMS